MHGNNNIDTTDRNIRLGLISDEIDINDQITYMIDENILENEVNLNVLIDKNSDNGINSSVFS